MFTDCWESPLWTAKHISRYVGTKDTRCQCLCIHYGASNLNTSFKKKASSLVTNQCLERKSNSCSAEDNKEFGIYNMTELFP